MPPPDDSEGRNEMANSAVLHEAAERPVRAVGRAGLRVAGVLVLVCVVVVAALAVVVPRLAGAVPLTVLSNSMAPTMPVGSLAVVRPTMETLTGEAATLDAAEIDAVNDVVGIGVGDVIVFAPNERDARLVMHRVTAVSVSTDGQRVFTTQGDNNSGVDDPVHGHQVRAVVWYHLPLLGYVNDMVSDNARLSIGVAAAVVGYGWAIALFVRAARPRPVPAQATAKVVPGACT